MSGQSERSGPSGPRKQAAARLTAAPSATVAGARRVIEIEAEALGALAESIGPSFERAVDAILACEGRLVVTGMGKSGLVCRKIAATFASTGTSALFLHAAEAAHGDLGMFARGDVCLAVSNSGRTAELVSLLPAIKRLALPLIAITGDPSSPLAEAADAVLEVRVPREACPLGLAPTASTTATMALGDALAVTVLERRGFSERDFALLHPGGALGTKLLRVSEVMSAHTEVPHVSETLAMTEVLTAMTAGGLGVVAVLSSDGDLRGVITDGDVRRGVLRHERFIELPAGQVMTASPKTISGSALAAEALAIMEAHSITSLFILDEAGRKPCGIVHLHDLLRAGVA